MIASRKVSKFFLNMLTSGESQIAMICMLWKFSLDVCKDELRQGLEKDAQIYGRIGAKILYNWTLLNEMNTESMTNWQQLLEIVPSDEADEGTIYRYIMQTADLISQMGEIAAVGEAGAKNDEDKKYYSELKDLCSYTRSLLIQDPVVV